MVYLFGPRERVGDAFSIHVVLLEWGEETSSDVGRPGYGTSLAQ
jgi:hypothetical protein